MEFFAPLIDQLKIYLDQSLRLLPQILLAGFVLFLAWLISLGVPRMGSLEHPVRSHRSRRDSRNRVTLTAWQSKAAEKSHTVSGPSAGK